MRARLAPGRCACCRGVRGVRGADEQRDTGDDVEQGEQRGLVALTDEVNRALSIYDEALTIIDQEVTA